MFAIYFLRAEAISYDKTEDKTVPEKDTRLTRNTIFQDSSGIVFEKSILQETHVDNSGDIKHEEIGKVYIRNPPNTLSLRYIVIFL